MATKVIRTGPLALNTARRGYSLPAYLRPVANALDVLIKSGNPLSEKRQIGADREFRTRTSVGEYAFFPDAKNKRVLLGIKYFEISTNPPASKPSNAGRNASTAESLVGCLMVEQWARIECEHKLIALFAHVIPELVNIRNVGYEFLHKKPGEWQRPKLRGKEYDLVLSFNRIEKYNRLFWPS